MTKAVPDAVASILHLTWAVILLGLLLLVADQFIQPNVALLCDIHRREVLGHDNRALAPLYSAPLLASSAAVAPSLVYFAFLMLPRAAGVQLAAGLLVGVAAIVLGPASWRLSRLAASIGVAPVTTSVPTTVGGGSSSFALLGPAGAPKLRIARSVACAVFAGPAALALQWAAPGVDTTSRDGGGGDEQHKGQALTLSALALAWLAALAGFLFLTATDLRAAAAAQAAEGNGNGSEDEGDDDGGLAAIELSSDALRRAADASPTLKAGGGSGGGGGGPSGKGGQSGSVDELDGAVVGDGGADAVPSSYTFLTITDTQYDSKGDFMKRPGIRVNLKTGAHEEVRGGQVAHSRTRTVQAQCIEEICAVSATSK